MISETWLTEKVHDVLLVGGFDYRLSITGFSEATDIRGNSEVAVLHSSSRIPYLMFLLLPKPFLVAQSY